jgi:hypothetical protein
MNINEVKTAKLVGKINLLEGHPKKHWKVEWDKTMMKMIKDKSGRVYLITSDKIIKKIGGSQDKGGLKGTIGAYQDSACSGKPSIRTYGVHMIIYEELLMGKEVEIYLIKVDKVMAVTKGLFGPTEEMLLNLDFRETENICKQEYYEIYGKYPDWNFQENKAKWPLHISEECEEINKNSNNKRRENNTI